MSTTKLTRREQREHAQRFIDTLAGTAFPNSGRVIRIIPHFLHCL